MQQKLKRYVLEDFSPRNDTDDEGAETVPEGGVGETTGEARAGERRDEPTQRRSAADSYKPLGDFLKGFSTDTVMISFAALENILKRKLPPSARERETWWTNKPRGRGHAVAWRDVGWKVDGVDLKKGRVVFVRLSEAPSHDSSR